MTGPGTFEQAAAPALAFAEGVAALRRGEPPELLRSARDLLDRFADDLRAAGVPRAAVPPARLALGLVIDAAGRANPRLPRAAWSAGAHRLLFEGEEMSPARLRAFVAQARGAGSGFTGAAAFLEGCLARVEEGREPGGPRGAGAAGSDGWGASLSAGLLGFLLLAAAWTLHAEWAFHRDAGRAFAAEALRVGLDRTGELPDLAARLDALALAVGRAEDTAARAPVHLLAGPLGWDAGAHARDALEAARARHLPRRLAQGIDAALATEGEGAALDDTLGAWAILSGEAPWDPGYLAGWVEAREAALPELEGLAPHVEALGHPPWPPPRPLPPRDAPLPDARVLAQAREIAREARPEERAWTRLSRSPAMRALAPWRPDLSVPGLAEVMLRRSGRPLSAGLPGAFTQAGWALATSGGAAEAVATAQGVAVADADPEAVEKVLDRLQAETVAAWSGLLGDLRVRPLRNRAAGRLVAGLLARRPSALEALIEAAWAEAGGGDLTRGEGQQAQVTAALGLAINHVRRGDGARIAALFAELSAALAARDPNEAARAERLASVRRRFAADLALGRAPLLVANAVEDVLAQTTLGQTAEARVDELTNPVTARWQADVLDACRRAVDGRFPFDPAGPDAEPADLAALLGPGGALDGFLRGAAAGALDSSAQPWRWRPEARFDGLAPEGAELLQALGALGATLYPPDRPPGGIEVGFAALAERGQAAVSVGGASAAVLAAGGQARLAWPGPDPQAGAAVVIEAPGGRAEESRPGPWGLVRLLAERRLRERDEGRRFLVDLQVGGGRLFLEVTFDSAANPLRAARIARGLNCPAAL